MQVMLTLTCMPLTFSQTTWTSFTHRTKTHLPLCACMYICMVSALLIFVQLGTPSLMLRCRLASVNRLEDEIQSMWGWRECVKWHLCNRLCLIMLDRYFGGSCCLQAWCRVRTLSKILRRRGKAQKTDIMLNTSLCFSLNRCLVNIWVGIFSIFCGCFAAFHWLHDRLCSFWLLRFFLNVHHQWSFCIFL